MRGSSPNVCHLAKHFQMEIFCNSNNDELFYICAPFLKIFVPAVEIDGE